MNFYVYRQNNCGGVFIGPKFVIVQANSADQADDLAVEHGDVYFHGCASGTDCSCCGDRWHMQWGDDDAHENLNDAIDYCKRSAYDAQIEDQILIIENVDGHMGIREAKML